MIIVSYISVNRSYNFIVDLLSVVLNSMAIIIHFKLFFSAAVLETTVRKFEVTSETVKTVESMES